MEDDRQRDSENAGSSQMHGNEEDGRTDGTVAAVEFDQG